MHYRYSELDNFLEFCSRSDKNNLSVHLPTLLINYRLPISQIKESKNLNLCSYIVVYLFLLIGRINNQSLTVRQLTVNQV